ncbi:TetR/AcrR family transcriptional regulator [Nocardia sp. BMG111209]|uniref:TetR/AcrR family transcriptional regulator n=1 Tax=Nocardia sp. BMG111209 TaxID=1160137 RepID=UPI001E45F141|nr:TetR/AcrR family transcriptional regulator [Nocardia sp. BMG111209]
MSQAPELPDAVDPRRVRSRDRLIAAATQLLASGGIEAVTVDAVTRASKVARTTLYRNFGNSAGLLAAAFERLLPQVVPPAPEGTLEQQLTELLTSQAAAIEQVPMQLSTLAWMGLGLGPTSTATADDPSPVVKSLRASVIEHYRVPFDRVLETPAARARLGDHDRIFVFAQLLGPIIFMKLTGLRTVTPDDCARIVRDFLAAHPIPRDSQHGIGAPVPVDPDPDR